MNNKILLLLIFIFILLFSLLNLFSTEYMVSIKVFTDGLVNKSNVDNLLKKEHKLIKDMDYCLKNRNNNFYRCINTLDIQKPIEEKPFKRSIRVDYIKKKDVKHLELPKL